METGTPSTVTHPNEKYSSSSWEGIMSELDDRNLPYRAGWPRLTPLPLRTTRNWATWRIPNCYLFIRDVKEIFEGHSIFPEEAFFAWRTPYAITGDPEHPSVVLYHTLVVTVCVEEYTRSEINKVIAKTRHFFMRNPELKNTSIEVIDYRALTDLNTYMVDPQYDLVETRKEITDIVMEEVRARDQNCLKIEFLRRGVFAFEDRERCPHTVVITTPTAGEEVWWKEIVPAVRDRLQAIVNKVQVEILQGAVQRVASEEMEQCPETVVIATETAGEEVGGRRSCRL